VEQLHVVITDSTLPDTSIEDAVLAPLGVSMTVGQCRTEEDVLAISRDADALMVQFAPITRRVIEQLTRCKVISRFGVGVDMVDLDAARDHGIPVKNVPDYCVEEVASHALGFMLALGRQLFLQDRLMHQGLWRLPDSMGPIERLRNQTLGLVGLGRIGRKLAEFAAPLGLRIIGCDVQPPEILRAVTVVDLTTVLRESDYLSLHCPLTADTRHLINGAALRQMKRTAFLINVSRGGVVDTVALVDALVRKQIAGAALDVFEQEPLSSDHALRALENVILTPHSAAISSDAIRQLRQDTARHVFTVLEAVIRAEGRFASRG
jgi:D-3-phosphoglycerate dehydrogenase